MRAFVDRSVAGGDHSIDDTPLRQWLLTPQGSDAGVCPGQK